MYALTIYWDKFVIVYRIYDMQILNTYKIDKDNI